MEITIKEKSWHTKLYKWFYNTEKLPQSLCNYFWALISKLLAVLYLSGMFLFLIHYIYNWSFNWVKVVGIFIGFTLGIITIVLYNKINNFEIIEIIKSQIKAKKDKVCPKINWIKNKQ